MMSNNFEFKKKMAERIDRARVIGLLFDDGLDLSDCDSDEVDEVQVSSYLGDELLGPEELSALTRAEVQLRMLDALLEWSFCDS